MTDPILLQQVAFTKHINLGGELVRYLNHQGNGLCEVTLWPGSGMVQVTRPTGEFWVGAAFIETCEEHANPHAYFNPPEEPKKAAALKDQAKDGVHAAAQKSGKRADAAPKSRADEILAELGVGQADAKA